MVFAGIVLAGVAVAAVLSFRAIGDNMLFYYSPTKLRSGEVPLGETVRIGGLVVDGSVTRANGDLTVRFDLTDTANTVAVRYIGILPDLFREGQGIVALGRLGPNGVFTAEEVLAKHDEKYMPPEVADSLKTASAARSAATGPTAALAPESRR